MTPSASTPPDRRRLAAEVLELGETLFDAVLDAAAHPDPAAENDPFPETELRTAADEFFRSLRVLLGMRSSAPDITSLNPLLTRATEVM